jgi:hypothetical protein
MGTGDWDQIPDDDPLLNERVTAALARLDSEAHDRAARELAEFLAQSRAMAEWAAVRRVAPYWRRPIAGQVGAEAARRASIGDTTAPVWRAWAEAAAARV